MGFETAQIAQQQQPPARQRRQRVSSTSSVWNPLVSDRWWPTTESELARYYLPTLSYEDDWSDEWVRLACERGVLSPQFEQDAAGRAQSSSTRRGRRWPLARAHSDTSHGAGDSEPTEQIAELDPPPYCSVDPAPLSSAFATCARSSSSPTSSSLHTVPGSLSFFAEVLSDDIGEPEPTSVRRASSAGSTDSGYVSILSRLSRHSSRQSQTTVASQDGEHVDIEQPRGVGVRRKHLSLSIRKKKGGGDPPRPSRPPSRL
ncbi:hypothetical protein BMF94_1764 [Rhodotorula taiwanensis]|uniref:Uncharacterized protein n=1 Tax=Rhodotorula taiwanensis TaxID=741276 RepID=A0A2S5BED9_9BASI|nr:hypothetical protein BMF94_1764 [Rhodotorula taiwanensis]